MPCSPPELELAVEAPDVGVVAEDHRDAGGVAGGHGARHGGAVGGGRGVGVVERVLAHGLDGVDDEQGGGVLLELHGGVPLRLGVA